MSEDGNQGRNALSKKYAVRKPVWAKMTLPWTGAA